MSSKILDRIQDAAIEEFARSGYNATTTKDVADRAEVTEGSIYRLFRTKRELFERCVSIAVTRSYSADDFSRNLVGRSLRERLQNALTAQWARSHAVDFRLGLAAIVETPEFARDTILRELRIVRELIVHAIDEERKREGIHRGIDSAVAADMLLAPFLRFPLFRDDGDPIASIDVIARLLDVWTSGVCLRTDRREFDTKVVGKAKKVLHR